MKTIFVILGVFLLFLPLSTVLGNDTYFNGNENIGISKKVELNRDLGFGILWNTLMSDEGNTELLDITRSSTLITQTYKAKDFNYKPMFSSGSEVSCFDEGDIVKVSFSKPRNNAYVLGFKLTLKGIRFSNGHKSEPVSNKNMEASDRKIHFSIFFDAPAPRTGI